MELFGLLIFTILMFFMMKQLFIKLGIGIKTTNQKAESVLTPFGHILKLFLTGSAKKDGLMNSYTQSKHFSSFNDGLLIDGKNKRLSSKDSFNHLALVSRTGGGKTSSYVIPNIFKLAETQNSLVITDISGELYEKTSGYLASKDYKIYVLNPEDLNESIGYNPLHYCKNSVDIDEVASILVKSNKEQEKTQGENEYWENGAKSVITMFIKLLLLKNNPKHMNLANVKYLINNYGIDGEDLRGLFDSIDDEKLKDEFNALSKINPNTLTSIIATANIALNPIGINDNLEKLTAHHTIDFDKLRAEKSVVYIKIPGHKQKQYRFLLNIFYTQFFNHMMEKLPSKNDLAIYCLLDEFGNMNLPSFDTTITTIRKYKISISLILQDINQLEKTYGKANASTILNGGISSKLFYSGAGLPTTKMLSEMLGTVEDLKLDSQGNFYYKEKPVMKSSEIRTMNDDEALFIMANLLPAKLKIKPYYKDFVFKQFAKMEPYKSNSQNSFFEIDFIEIY